MRPANINNRWRPAAVADDYWETKGQGVGECETNLETE